MIDETIVDFDKAKRPHVYRRKESKVSAIRKAFKAARGGGAEKPPPKGKGKRKKKK